MFVRPRVLSILTTRQCTAACDHCCVGASPKARSRIPVDRIHRLIDEAARVPSIERITFTGGECFLLGPDLDALVGHAHGRGFAVRAISNGYWAVDGEAARKRLARLRRHGLGELMLSTGTFHQKFVPVERIAHAVRAAAAHGIAVRVSIEDCDQDRWDEAPLVSELADLIAGRRVQLVRDPWITDAGGRGAAALSNDTFLAGHPDFASGACRQILDGLSVTPDQQLVACCGFPQEELPRLRIGSVAEEPLDELLARTPDGLLKMWLHVSGPHGIAEFVSRHVPGYALPRAASICESCVVLQRDARAMSVITEHGHEVAREIASAYVRLQTQPRHPISHSSPTPRISP